MKLVECLRQLEGQERIELAKELLDAARIILGEIESDAPEGLLPEGGEPGRLSVSQCPEFCAQCPFLRPGPWLCHT
jgi:hypothetical protein